MSAASRWRDMFRRADGRSHVLTFVLLGALFLLWGFCNGMLDVLNKHFQNSLRVSMAGSALVQFSNYMGYFVMAVPAGLLARRFGYRVGILTGLLLVAAGALWFIPATRIGTFGAFLAGLFVLAAGLAVLETVANPYATVLGPARLAAARINLAQTANGVGLILGPLVAGHFVLSSTAEVNRSNESLYLPYAGVGVLVVALAATFVLRRIPELEPDETTAAAGGVAAGGGPLARRRHFVLAVVAQLLYVGAQVGIFSFFINYLVAEMPTLTAAAAARLPGGWTFPVADGARLTERAAAQLLSYGGFGLFLAGRFTGSLALRRLPAHATLAMYALVNVLAMALVVLPLGWVSVAALFASFFFMSIMFPTIFSLGIMGLGERTQQASSFIVMAIVGGALLPLAMGAIADQSSMRAGFIAPLVCFAGVAAYGASWRRLFATRGVRKVS